METCSEGHIAITWDDHYGDVKCPLCAALDDAAKAEDEAEESFKDMRDLEAKLENLREELREERKSK